MNKKTLQTVALFLVATLASVGLVYSLIVYGG